MTNTLRRGRFWRGEDVAAATASPSSGGGTRSASERLLAASKSGDIEGVTAALKAYAGVNSSDADKNTPLYWAARDGALPIIKLLLDADADVSTANKLGVTPLMMAAAGGWADAEGGRRRRLTAGGRPIGEAGGELLAAHSTLQPCCNARC